MTIEEMKARIAEIDNRLDDESISNEEFDALEKEAQALTAEIGKLENATRFSAVKILSCVNDWSVSFLSSFACGTRKVTNRQAEIFKRFNNGQPFIYNERRFDCGGANYRAGFGTLVVTKI